MIAYIFVWWWKVCLFGGLQDVKEDGRFQKPQDFKREYFRHGGADWKSNQDNSLAP